MAGKFTYIDSNLPAEAHYVLSGVQQVVYLLLSLSYLSVYYSLVVPQQINSEDDEIFNFTSINLCAAYMHALDLRKHLYTTGHVPTYCTHFD